MKGLNDGMNLRVRQGKYLSDPFEISRVVKQGCVHAPVLLNIYVQCITRLLSAMIDERHLLTMNYRTDHSLFDLRKLQAKTKISKSNILELQYVDNCALVSDSSESLKRVLYQMTSLYRKLGLSIKVQKTEYMRFTPQLLANFSGLSIDGSALKEVDCFKYLGSNISANAIFATKTTSVSARLLVHLED